MKASEVELPKISGISIDPTDNRLTRDFRDNDISKEEGTALLYSRFLNTKNKRVFLIAPPSREEEFKRLGCEIPKDVVISFVPKGPAMDKLFQDELAKHGLKQSVRHKY